MAGKDVATGEREIVTDADGEREWVGLGEIVGEVEGDRVIEEDGVGDRLMDAVGDEQGDADIFGVTEKDVEGLGLELGLGQADGSTDMPVAPQAAGHVQSIGVSVLNGQ